MWKKTKFPRSKMLESRTLELNGIGRIQMVQSSRAKRLSITIKPFKGVRVAVPLGVSFSLAETFARIKTEWIRKNLTKMQKLERKHKAEQKGTNPISRQKARKILVERLNTLSKRFGFTYNKVFIRNQKTRWGSCSAKNNINLNMNLIRLPSDLIDYTLLHELVHTRVKNHSSTFWNELNKIVGDAKKLDKKLSRYIILNEL